MIIGIDASRALRANRTGTERYSLELINALLDLPSEHRLRLYAPARPQFRLFREQAELVVLRGQRLWTHTRLGPHTRRHPPDVLFVPSHVLPIIGPPRMAVTVHDLGYEYFPQAHDWRQRFYLRWSTRRHTRVAACILADSAATKADLIRFYQADPARVHVVPLALDPAFRREREPGRIAAVRRSYGIPPDAPYLLHVGTIHPRKNLARLVEALAQVRQRPAGRDLMLVLAGGMGFAGKALLQQVREQGLADVVRFIGFARMHDIPALYSGAACYAFPSLHEGFGFPALEAQACETPLLCARTSSLPEVAGEGALYIDPLDVQALAAGLERLLEDSDLRRTLIAAGSANVQRFSWQRTAQETLRLLEMAAA